MFWVLLFIFACCNLYFGGITGLFFYVTTFLGHVRKNIMQIVGLGSGQFPLFSYHHAVLDDGGPRGRIGTCRLRPVMAHPQ
jgi:hypothetical protein